MNEHLESLVRHLRLVQEACLLLARKWIKEGRLHDAQMLASRGFKHDNSKFFGIEWDNLHLEEADHIPLAVQQHRESNDHHPEHWGGINRMPEVCLAEMVCDWYSRSQEFGSDLREWIKDEAIPKWKPTKRTLAKITRFVNALLGKPFKRV